MLFRSRAPPPFSSFRPLPEAKQEGPALYGISRTVAGGSSEEKREALAGLALMMDRGEVGVEDAIGIFAGALDDEDASVRRLSFLNIARLGPRGIEGIFLGVFTADTSLRVMSLDRIYRILAADGNVLRCGFDRDVIGLGPKIDSLLSVLGDEEALVRTKATSCLRELARRSPLVVLERTSSLKAEGVLSGTELFFRMRIVESAAEDALSESGRARC